MFDHTLTYIVNLIIPSNRSGGKLLCLICIDGDVWQLVANINKIFRIRPTSIMKLWDVD